MEKCQKAMKKCPDLPSPYEMTGDLKIKENQAKEAIVDYHKALVLAISKERIKDKIDRYKALMEEKRVKEAEQAREKAVMSVGGVRLSEYPKLDESTRLAWCEYWISRKKESLDERRRESKSGRPFVLNMNAARLDKHLMAMSKLDPILTVHDCAARMLENAVDHNVHVIGRIPCNRGTHRE